MLSNNLDEVRDEWERIKLAYEILKDKKTRKRYDRHEMIVDPKAAIGRAASDAAWNGIKGLGKGMFDIGAFAVNQIVKSTNEQEKHA
jgi:DnaJ-class molecular chaperone